MMTQFSLSWEEHKQNICSGLSTLQQNGEFVDMTIAADGHHVKVHQMVLSLVSPYIKDLISSAQCPHPIIFLNKTTYPTLCAILEYIYTGEVMVAKENLPELVEAARELHIKGLAEMKLELSTHCMSQAMTAKQNEGQPLSETGFFKNEPEKDGHDEDKICGLTVIRGKKRKRSAQDSYMDETHAYDSEDHEFDTMEDADNSSQLQMKVRKAEDVTNGTCIQYTVSNAGSLQVILNRYIYNLNYTSRRSGQRRWACVDKRDRKCPATVVTDNDIVVQRNLAHNHAFHDKKILRKVNDKAVYYTLHDAQTIGDKKRQRRQLDTTTTQSVDKVDIASKKL